MTQELPVPQLLRLADGRVLAWYEFGDPAGVPAIFTSGTPESGLAGACYHQAALHAGVRWISPDKPGYGHSDFQPRRQLLDWPADIITLADHLEIERFTAVGESGGAPYAFAIAHQLPGRVTTTVILAGMGPGHEPWVRADMRPSNRAMFFLAQHAPPLLVLPIAAMGHALRDPARRAAYLKRVHAAAPEVDRARAAHPEFRSRADAAADAFRLGTRAVVQEMTMLAQPWGFELGEVAVPVHLWHGTVDTNVPVAVARRLAAELPDATEHIHDSGHTIGFEHREEIMNFIAGGH